MNRLVQALLSSTTRPLGVEFKVLQYFRAHPLLLIVFLSLGIPEYLSGSSSMALLVLNPSLFLYARVYALSEIAGMIDEVSYASYFHQRRMLLVRALSSIKLAGPSQDS